MKTPDHVTHEMLQHLPEPVQRYMNWTGVVGKPWTRTAYVRPVSYTHLTLPTNREV